MAGEKKPHKHDKRSDLTSLEAAVATLADLHVQTSIALEQVRAEIRLAVCSGDGQSQTGPTVDRSRFAICWGRRRCDLGPTLLFRLIERLLRRPDHYLTQEILLQDVWHGDRRSADSVRSAIRHLRARLTEARMSTLAKAIRSTGGCCGVFLSDRRA